jgi:uncharacterized protein (TIGR01777 family)
MPMKIAIAGYRGFLGRAIRHQYTDIQWIKIEREALYGETGLLIHSIEGADVVINLAGSSIARRWTARNKKEIIRSRFGINSRLVAAINALSQKPRMFITASAIGIYDHHGIHTETEFNTGRDFLAEVVSLWEEPLKHLDGSVCGVRARIGMVLGREGGALPRLLQMARFKILPILGSGKQYYSFIHVEDLATGLMFIIEKNQEGVYNMCAPHPVDNATFTRILASKTGVPFTFRVPSFLLKLFMGDSHMVISKGQYVLPARLSREGFKFRYPHIGDAFENLLK